MNLSTAINLMLLAGLIVIGVQFYFTSAKIERNAGTLSAMQEQLKQAEQGAAYLEGVIRDWDRETGETLEKWREAETLDRDAESRLSSLEGVFLRHDLAFLAKAKPQLVENIVNQGTRKAMKRLSCVSDISRTDC